METPTTAKNTRERQEFIIDNLKVEKDEIKDEDGNKIEILPQSKLERV